MLDELQSEAASQAIIVPGSPRPHNTIIVFPGSFNPLTTAHLALMKQARQHMYMIEKGRQKVLLYAAISKHIVDKEYVERPLLLDRIMLLDRVLRHRLRYTGVMLFNKGLYVEQARAIHVTFPKVKRILFLIGFDKIVQILDPRYYEDRDSALTELFGLAELLVAPRGEDGLDALKQLLEQAQNQAFAHAIHALPFSSAYRDISSTRIREHPGAYRHEIPYEVRNFMRKTRAYAPPLCLADGTQIDYYAERVKALETLLKKVNGGR